MVIVYVSKCLGFVVTGFPHMFNTCFMFLQSISVCVYVCVLQLHLLSPPSHINLMHDINKNRQTNPAPVS